MHIEKDGVKMDEITPLTNEKEDKAAKAHFKRVRTTSTWHPPTEKDDQISFEESFEIGSHSNSTIFGKIPC